MHKAARQAHPAAAGWKCCPFTQQHSAQSSSGEALRLAPASGRMAWPLPSCARASIEDPTNSMRVLVLKGHMPPAVAEVVAKVCTRR